jgi:hypothetical protein
VNDRLPVLCDSCKRRTGDRTCHAYPAGIPTAIVDEFGDHRQPRGDEKDGLVYQGDPAKQEPWFEGWLALNKALSH